MAQPKITLDLDSKFLRKLLETTACGVGAVAGAWLRTRDARANADALRIEAQGQRDAEDIYNGRKVLTSDGGLLKVSEEDSLPSGEIFGEGELQARLMFQESKRQKNVKAIFDAAVQYADGPVSDDDVDDDWIARFFTYAQDVSSVDMQDIWGRILSGEVKQPQSFSLRTLEVLKSLSKKDAVLFEKVRPFVFADFLPNNLEVLKKYDVTLDEISELEDAGLINASFGRVRIFLNQSQSEKYVSISELGGGKAIVICHDQAGKQLKLGSHDLTEAGKQINNILPPVEKNIPFFSELLNTKSGEGFTFQMAPIDHENRVQISLARDLRREE